VAIRQIQPLKQTLPVQLMKSGTEQNVCVLKTITESKKYALNAPNLLISMDQLVSVSTAIMLQPSLSQNCPLHV